jgi:hypothetical protein
MADDMAAWKTAKSFRFYQIISQGSGRPGVSRTAAVGCCDPLETLIGRSCNWLQLRYLVAYIGGWLVVGRLW